MIGEIIAEFEGKVAGLRILPDDKIEGTDTGIVKILGITAGFFDTTIQTPMPDGIFIIEAKSIATTDDLENISMKFNGMAWTTGKGFKSKFKGIAYFKTEAQRFLKLNKTLALVEQDEDEEGKWTAKMWELK